MPKRMLIDASHPEETRVVVLDGQKVEEFDFESASKKPLKGNIYLAKVTRVEPSLQAAFVEYGGNRQGFLAFSEIHPDYYQIPVADRQALIAEQEAEARRRAEEEFEIVETGTALGEDLSEEEEEEEAEESEETSETGESAEPGPDLAQELGPAEADIDLSRELDSAAEEPVSAEEPEDDDHEEIFDNKADQPFEDHHEEEDRDEHEEPLPEEMEAAEEEPGESEIEVAAESEIESEHPAQPLEAAPQEQQARALQQPRPPQRWMRRRHYKIQEVIKRRQIILVQVVKEERGNKGAALTTYLSLAGRYCVLMPNTPRGGGISRKITNAADRKRLKSAAATLDLPEGMGLIIRTAGESRTKLEIKRDYEYLLRMWDQIRELTLKSNAPACVYEEGDLIKRAIRDLYNKDVGEIVVEGEDGYKNAKEFMRMLMPSHAKNVKLYRESVPLFQRQHIEAQLDAMFSPTVTLRSGGYIVINQTEALVSIDVNSGRATREHNIEDTAYKTNLEAAEEISRQLRLRDLAGLIVIDFIDMEDQRNDRNVEKRLRDCVKNDRARIQIGKISQFGLLEMSRQRLRAGVIAGSTVPCPHCAGQGIVRSVESTALRVLRALEEEAQRQKASAVAVHVAQDVAIYTLNQKRRELARIETDYGMTISFEPETGLPAGHFEIERTQQKSPDEKPRLPAPVEAMPEIEEEEPEIVEEEEEEEAEEIAEQQAQPQPQGEGGGRRRRRRRRRGGRDRDNGMGTMQESIPPTHGQLDYHGQENGNVEFGEAEPRHQPQPQQNDGEGGRRRRRRRRGRRGRGGEHHQQFGNAPAQISPPRDSGSEAVLEQVAEAETPAPAFGVLPNAPSTPSWSFAERAAPPLDRAPPAPAAREEPKPAIAEPAPMRPEPDQPARKGWWQKAFRRD